MSAGKGIDQTTLTPGCQCQASPRLTGPTEAPLKAYFFTTAIPILIYNEMEFTVGRWKETNLQTKCFASHKIKATILISPSTTTTTTTTKNKREQYHESVPLTRAVAEKWKFLWGVPCNLGGHEGGWLLRRRPGTSCHQQAGATKDGSDPNKSALEGWPQPRHQPAFGSSNSVFAEYQAPD